MSGVRGRPVANFSSLKMLPGPSFSPPNGMTDQNPVNIGTHREITIRDLVTLIADLTGFKGEVRWDATKPDGQPRRMLDTTRAREYFGFEAQIDLEEGLGRTIAWWQEHSDR